MTIDCFYDLAGGTLYSINWRFKGMEFLRLLRQFHVPSSSSSSSSSSFYVSPTSSSSSTSSSKSHQRSGDRQYTGRQKKPKTTKSPSSKPLPQMNMVFTPVQGIDIDVSPPLFDTNGYMGLRDLFWTFCFVFCELVLLHTFFELLFFSCSFPFMLNSGIYSPR